VVKRWISTTTA